MGKFVVEPHFRLQEWGGRRRRAISAPRASTTYISPRAHPSTAGQHHTKRAPQGRFQSIEKGREADVSCACTGRSMSRRRSHAKLYAERLFGGPSGISRAGRFAHPQPGRPGRRCPISVGYQSAAITQTVQALSIHEARVLTSRSKTACCSAARASDRRQEPRRGVVQRPYYLVEQLGFRKIIDTDLP